MYPELSFALPPVASNRERSDRLIYASIALTSICVLPVVFLSNAGGLDAIQLARIVLCSLWLLGACLSLGLVKLGRRRLAAIGIIGVTWSSATFFLFYTGIGLHSAVVFLYLPSILYSALLLGVCPAAMQTVITIIVLGMLVWAEDSGRIGGIHAYAQHTTNFNFAVGVAIACVASMVVASVYERAVNQMVKLLEKSKRELQAAHQEVTSLNQALLRRVAERTRELEETIGDLESFNYTVAHDLRTPLRALNGYASALLEDYAGRLDFEGRRMLERIAAAALRLDALQSALLELGRIGVRPIELRRIDLSAVAERVVENLRKSNIATNTQFRIGTGLDEDCDPNLAPALLRYILENAVKFSAGSAQPLVEFGRIESATGPKFFVRDNGIGFNPDYQKKLFQPFYQLHAASEHHGLGIGLACARRIVERHRGALWAEGRENGGATFYFTLAPHAETALPPPA
jgi:signal transduction histidine kinase